MACMTWAACTAWARSSTRATNRYSTSRGKPGYFALLRAMRASDKLTIDAFRHAVELIPAPEYLRMSYYEQRLHALIELMVKSGLVTRAEVESGKPAPGSPKATPALIASAVPGMVAKGKPASRDVRVEAGFTVGQRVRVRNIHPTGHRRLPR